MMKKTIAGAMCAACILICAQAPAAPVRASSAAVAATMDARFAAIHRAEWQWRIKEQLARDESSTLR